MRFVAYIVAFYVILCTASGLTVAYFLRYLEMPYKTATSLFLIISLLQIVFIGIWGRINGKKGYAFALRAAIWFFIGENLFIGLSGRSSYIIFIPVSFTISAFANGGFNLSLFNRKYELIPEDKRVLYDSFFTAAVGIGFILGPLTGNALKTLLESSDTVSGLMPFAGIRLVYFAVAAGLLLLQIFSGRTGRKEEN